MERTDVALARHIFLESQGYKWLHKNLTQTSLRKRFDSLESASSELTNGETKMVTPSVKGPTKLTAKLYADMSAAFDRQLSNTLLRRDAFLDRIIWQEIPYLHEDLKGKRLSQDANRYISSHLKQLGGKDAPPLRQVSIALRRETADALRAVVEEHNLVRDAFLNRLITLLRSSDRLLDALGLPKRVAGTRRDGTEDMPTSPMRSIEETLSDPFHYLRAACESQYGHGLNLLVFPAQLIGLSCYLDDDQVPGTQARKQSEDDHKKILANLEHFEANLTPIKQEGV